MIWRTIGQWFCQCIQMPLTVSIVHFNYGANQLLGRTVTEIKTHRIEGIISIPGGGHQDNVRNVSIYALGVQMSEQLIANTAPAMMQIIPIVYPGRTQTIVSEKRIGAIQCLEFIQMQAIHIHRISEFMDFGKQPRMGYMADKNFRLHKSIPNCRPTAMPDLMPSSWKP